MLKLRRLIHVVAWSDADDNGEEEEKEGYSNVDEDGVPVRIVVIIMIVKLATMLLVVTIVFIFHQLFYLIVCFFFHPCNSDIS